MLSKIRRHLSFANVVSVIALFVALGGVAYAANTIGSPDVIDNSLQSVDLKDNAAVKSVDVRDDTLAGGGLRSQDIANGSIGSADLAPSEAPQTPTLLNCQGSTAWTEGDFDTPPHYWIDNADIVHFEGSVSCAGDASPGGAIFQLPDKYTPAQSVVRFGVLGSGLSLAQVAVVKTGSYVAFDGGTNGSVTDNYLSLDGITYRAGP
jgi:hypothetical protein